MTTRILDLQSGTLRPSPPPRKVPDLDARDDLPPRKDEDGNLGGSQTAGMVVSRVLGTVRGRGPGPPVRAPPTIPTHSTPRVRVMVAWPLRLLNPCPSLGLSPRSSGSTHTPLEMINGASSSSLPQPGESSFTRVCRSSRLVGVHPAPGSFGSVGIPRVLGGVFTFSSSFPSPWQAPPESGPGRRSSGTPCAVLQGRARGAPVRGAGPAAPQKRLTGQRVLMDAPLRGSSLPGG